jgi:hypothetical protein
MVWLKVHQQKYRASDSNKNVDIKYTMSVSKHRLLEGWYTRRLKVHQQKYRASGRRVYHPSSSLCLDTDMVYLISTFLLLSLARYFCWWTFSLRVYHPPSSLCLDIKYTMAVYKHRLLGGWYTRGLKVHQQKYRASDSNKNIEIKYTMAVSKHRLLGGWYTRGLKVHQQKYCASDSN